MQAIAIFWEPAVHNVPLLQRLLHAEDKMDASRRSAEPLDPLAIENKATHVLDDECGLVRLRCL